MRPKVHQILHGYSDGHRMISGSLSLSSADARTMIVMSDLSGAGIRPDPSGYITGYPLEGGGRYVLARTWAAPEMPRPGCVWTHSLMIENADLATLKSSDELLAAFRRPSGLNARADYAAPIVLPVGPPRPLRVRDRRARSVMNALYAAPGSQVVASAEEPAEDEELLLAIWMQQWPRLRRAFGFCTLAGMDRSSKGVRLDIQLVPDLDRSARSRFPGAVLPQDVGFEGALAVLQRDLEGADDTKLREFLRRAGGDVDGGRRAMVPLCRLHASLFSADVPDFAEAVAALGSLGDFGKTQARSVRSMVVRRAIDEIDNLNEEVFDFVMEAVEDGSASDWVREYEVFGAALWRRSPDRFFTVLDAGGDLGERLTNVLHSLPAGDLIQGIEASPEIASRCVSMRPDLMEHVDFWRGAWADLELLEGLDKGRAVPAALALIGAGIEAAASAMIPRVDAMALASILEGVNDGPVLETWLKELANSPNRAAAVLASGGMSRRRSLAALARQMDPDTVPNDYGEDPWLVAARAASGHLGQLDEDFLAAFLIARALGVRSRSRPELLRQFYTVVYRALEQSRLPKEVESLVTWRLNWVGWFGWDNCSRLRGTVVDLFVDQHLDPETFGCLTDDGRLATSLIDEAARSERGRRYLGEVRKALKNAPDKGFKARGEYIAKKIK
ncbi:GAP1-N1 domain-containing protein [Xanthomonas arboricola]